MYVNVTCNSQFPAIHVAIYRGVIDDNDVVLYDTLKTGRNTYELPANQYYSATAEYISGTKKIYALDCGELKTKYKKVCDSVCWSRVNRELDLELKDYFLDDD